MTNEELEKEVLTLKSDLLRLTEMLHIHDNSISTFAAFIGKTRDKVEDRVAWIEHKQEFDLRSIHTYALNLEDELGIEVLPRVGEILKDAVANQVKPKSFTGFGFNETA